MSLTIKKYRFLLAVSTGILLGISFPPIPIGVFAVVAFIPYFLLLETFDNYWQSFKYSYLMIFVFNFITLYWTGGFVHCRDTYMMIAGFAELFFHPIFYMLPLLGVVFIKKQFSYKTAIYSFPIVWVSFEYLHSLSEYAFPWVILGNTQTYDLSIIQFASITGVYGISFWLLCLNVMIFILFVKLAIGEWKVKSIKTYSLAFCIIGLYLLPKVYGTNILNENKDNIHNADKVKIALPQLNIDPFDKWTSSAVEQVKEYLNETRNLSNQNIDLVIWPETAIPFYLLSGANAEQYAKIRNCVDSLQINLLTGVPDFIYYSKNDIVSKSSKVTKSGLRYDTYNSSVLIKPGEEALQKYSKIKLVPYAERVPYSDFLSFLNAMQWNFGLGGWAIGKDTTVFNFKTNNGSEAKFSNFICFESVFPGFVASFVSKGAQFLTVISNDSWWGNTSGAYQHKQVAVMRAIENRRWIAQSTTGGISCFIDPYGRTVQSAKLYTKNVLIQDICINDEQTFYTRYGDWFAEICLTIALFIVIAALSNKFYKNFRERQNLYEIH